MDDATRELIEALRQAMQAERTGHTFYSMAAANTTDPMGTQVFEQLAREEREHFEFLATHYRSLLEQGTLARDVQLRAHGELTSDSPIFSPALRARIQDAHFEMSALAIAVQLEQNAIEHYRAAASRATLPEAKKFFEALVAWETSHYDALVRQQDALQDDYWSASGFQPF